MLTLFSVTLTQFDQAVLLSFCGGKTGVKIQAQELGMALSLLREESEVHEGIIAEYTSPLSQILQPPSTPTSFYSDPLLPGTPIPLSQLLQPPSPK